MFFPISTLPPVLRTIALFNPLYHCVKLVRDFSLGTLGPGDIVSAGVLVTFALIMWRLAIWRLESRLID
jgi:lipooligosaccharide transport system permease protein